MVLVVDVGCVQRPVGIPGHKRHSGGGLGSGEGPAIAAAAAAVEVSQGRDAVAQVLHTVRQRAFVVLAWRQYQQLPRLVSGEQLSRFFRADLFQYLRPPYLRLEHAHQDMPDFIRHQPVPRLPRFGAYAGDFVLRRQRLAMFDEGIDSASVGVEHTAGVLGHGPIVRPRAGFQTEPPHQFVLFQCRRTDDLRPPAHPSPPVVFHVPQTVLGGDKPLGEESVALV